MALDSQVGNLESIANNDLTGAVHELFAKGVKPHYNAESPVAQLFQQAGSGQYEVSGEKLVWSNQLETATGAMATSGNLPDHAYQDAVRAEITPVRAYVRRAVDNFEKVRARGQAAFQDFLPRIFDQQMEAFSFMRCRHAIGTSDGTLALIDSRTDATNVVLKDGFGHTGTNPLQTGLIEIGSVLAWIDVSAANAVGGAGVVTAIDYSTKTITLDSSATWEANGTPASGDLIVNATTNDSTTDYFDTEFENAPHGVFGDLVDPDGSSTTVFNISESTHPRWKPFREASSTFDHIEVRDHWRKAKSHSRSPVNRNTHVSVCQAAVTSELARTLTGFQQQSQLGREFMGGWQSVVINDMEFIEEDSFPHDVLVTLCMEDLYFIDLDGEAETYSEDGSQFSRLADFDGNEWFVRHYFAQMTDRRNRHAALTGISLPNYDADDFANVPHL